jgi:hypothetical protein
MATKAPALIHAKNPFYTPDHTADYSSYDCAEGTGITIALPRLLFDSARDALSLGSKRGRNYDDSECNHEG